MVHFRLRPYAVIAAVLGIVATLLLGNWQRHKADYRTVQQERIAAALQDAPLDVRENENHVELLFWHRVEARGVWMPEDVVYLDNRPNEGRVGLYVLMPLKLADGRVLIVNRGWLPRDPVERSRIAPYLTPAGELDVVGVARADEDRFLELARAPEARLGTIWENFDFDAFAKASASSPVRCIVREDTSANDGLVRNWPDRGNVFSRQIDRNRGYAFQWYAMSAAIVGLTLFYGFRNARHIRSAAT